MSKISIWTWFMGSVTERKAFVREFNLLVGRRTFYNSGEHAEIKGSPRDDGEKSWLIRGNVTQKEWDDYNLEMDWMIN
jgi:hypothetical protein